MESRVLPLENPTSNNSMLLPVKENKSNIDPWFPNSTGPKWNTDFWVLLLKSKQINTGGHKILFSGGSPGLLHLLVLICSPQKQQSLLTCLYRRRLLDGLKYNNIINTTAPLLNSSLHSFSPVVLRTCNVYLLGVTNGGKGCLLKRIERLNIPVQFPCTQ